MAISPVFQHYRLFSSFLFLLDLKLGCTILTLFNLFNKSAGVYGLLAIFQGGTLAQLSLYAYSLSTIFISLWGLRGISEESAPTVLLYAHLYLADHLVSSLWSFYFFQVVYHYTEHNGQPPALSPYQEGLMSIIESIESQYETKGVHHTPLVGDARVQAAQQVWKSESSFSATVLILGWFIKIYFALLLYSYALHLRHGTYQALPLSKPAGHTTAENRNGYLPVRASITIERTGEGEEEEEQQLVTAGQSRSGRMAQRNSNDDDGDGEDDGMTSRSLQEESLPAWSDDEMSDEGEREGEGTGQEKDSRIRKGKDQHQNVNPRI